MEERPPENPWLPPREPPKPEPPKEEPEAPKEPPKPEPEEPVRGEADSPEAFMRRLRSRLPTSPLPWHWHVRINRGLLAGIVLLVVGGAVASVLIQRSSDDEASEQQAPQASAQALGLLGKLKPAQKADSVVVIGFDDPAAAEADIRASQLGGVLVGPEDWAGGGAGLVGRLRAAGAGKGKIPPLLVARQEGGIYRFYPDLPPPERQVDVGDTADPAAAESWSSATNAALKQAGFDLNLAPLADVATLDSAVGDRAFGDDPAIVSEMTAAAVRGCAATGLGCAIAHFPGLGAASDDPAEQPATVGLDLASLESRDLAPFRAAFAAGAPATVLSLAFYAAIDPVTPAALSPGIATDLLRDGLGFKGVAITDDLSSGAISAGVGAPEAAVQALSAGSDLVVVSDPAQAAEVRAAILAAAASGELPASRLDEAAARVIDLKRTLGVVPAKG